MRCQVCRYWGADKGVCGALRCGSGVIGNVLSCEVTIDRENIAERIAVSSNVCSSRKRVDAMVWGSLGSSCESYIRVTNRP